LDAWEAERCGKAEKPIFHFCGEGKSTPIRPLLARAMPGLPVATVVTVWFWQGYDGGGRSRVV